ncbi:EF-Tu/IF-2/RF-3 family GTPase [Nocardia sp. IFM 10818]
MTESTAAAPFRMTIEGVFTITGRGTVVAGTVEQGAVSVGDDVEIIGAADVLLTRIRAIDFVRCPRTDAQARPNTLGLLLEGVHKDHIAVGDIVAAPNSADGPTGAR